MKPSVKEERIMRMHALGMCIMLGETCALCFRPTPYDRTWGCMVCMYISIANSCVMSTDMTHDSWRRRHNLLKAASGSLSAATCSWQLPVGIR